MLAGAGTVAGMVGRVSLYEPVGQYGVETPNEQPVRIRIAGDIKVISCPSWCTSEGGSPKGPQAAVALHMVSYMQGDGETGRRGDGETDMLRHRRRRSGFT